MYHVYYVRNTTDFLGLFVGGDRLVEEFKYRSNTIEIFLRPEKVSFVSVNIVGLGFVNVLIWILRKENDACWRKAVFIILSRNALRI